MEKAKRSFNFCTNMCAIFLSFLLLQASLSAKSSPVKLKEEKASEKDLLNTAQLKHGPDGALFLAPYFLPYLQNLKGCNLLDAGCGDGTWTILAAKNGAHSYGIDIQEGMIAHAKQAALIAGVSENTSFTVGDVENLPYLNNFFDRAISLNVGCNLSSLKKHLEELHRVLKKGGLTIITTPISLGSVFTDGKKPQEQIIKEVKNAVRNCTSELAFKAAIQEFNEIYRATFIKRNDKWLLVENESDLIKGEKIWRKIPRLTSANYYHPAHEYFAVFQQSGFVVKRIESPHFDSEEARLEYNNANQASLSEAYTKSPPFLLFIIEKI